MKQDIVFKRCQVDDDLVSDRAHEASAVFIDFDHTLFGCNSSELFIASCKPSFLAAIVDVGIRRCIPWQLTKLQHWFRVRDYICCLVLLALSPWNFFRWKRLAPDLFQRYASSSMDRALLPIDLKRITIITFGMAFIVRALLSDSRWRSVPLIATPVLPRPSLFMRGKRVILSSAVGSELVARSIFITDSMDDDDLLAAAGTGILIEPQGEMFRASERLYVPLRYTARAKYTPSYVLDQLIFVELALLVISISRTLGEFPSEILKCGLLYFSLICVYEIGYVENDTVGALREERPRLTPAVVRYHSYPMEPSAWVWAVMLAVAGIGMMFLSGSIESTGQAALTLVGWVAGLVALRLTFHIYNGPGLIRRVHVYPLLQLLKFLPIFVLLPPTSLGVVVILSQIATMWAIYLTYRMGGRSKDIMKEHYRVLMLAIGVALLCLTPVVYEQVLPFQLTALGLWCAARLCKAPVLRAFGKATQA